MPDPDLDREDHYRVLGVTRDATQDEIRKRYRELVRRYHPDARRGVGSDKEFVRIATAYRVLSDPDRRRQYDMESVRVPMPGTRPASSPRDLTRPHPAPTGEDILRRAERAFANGALHDARTLAEQALTYDPRSGRAHALIGDIYRSQGRMDEAINMYTIAVQLDPKNGRIADNLERLLRRTKARDEDYRLDPKARAEREKQAQEKQAMAGLLVLGMAIAAPFVIDLNVGGKVLGGFAPLATWTDRLLIVMVVESFLVGLLLALVGVLRRLDDEFVYERAFAATRRSGPPAGLYLVITGAMFFHLSMLLYIILGVVQDSFSRSLTVLYVVVLALTAALAMNFHVPGGTQQVMMWGGNVIFLCMLLGWLVGEIFRPGI